MRVFLDVKNQTDQDYTFSTLLLRMVTIYFLLERHSFAAFVQQATQSLQYGISRREFMSWATAAAIVAVRPAAGAALPSDTQTLQSGLISMSALDVALDILIPADTQTPSASQLGIARVIADQADVDMLFRSWLIEGLKWFDQGAVGSFIKRDAVSQTQLMQTLADSPIGSQTRIFFEQLRLRTMAAYYADPRSRVGLAIDRPPQPLGYLDFASRA